MIKDYVKLVVERSATKFSVFLLVLGFILSFASPSFAQKEKYNRSMCVYLENSEKIFVGTFQKQTENLSVRENESYTIAHFSVNQPLQGIRQNEDKISVVNDSYQKHLRAGELYLVFLRYDLIRLFESFGSSDFLPVGFSFRFNEKKKQWGHDLWENNIPKFEDFELTGFDNHLLSPNQSFTFTDLMEAVPFESLKTFPFKIKYKRIIYISFDKSETEVKAIESPVFIVTNLK